MNAEEVTKLSYQHPDCLFIDSEAKGLCYVVDQNRNGMVIIGRYGKTLLTKKQVIALKNEINEIAGEYLNCGYKI